jgi:thioredoxin-like negative regulator of GroEL
MSFWRKEVIEFALDRGTLHHIEEQRAWIAREPENPRPYKNLAQLYRIEGRQEEALGLLLQAVRLDSAFAEAHVELAEIYAIRGKRSAVELLERHQVPE